MATAAELAQRRALQRQQFKDDPSKLDAATRNKIREEQYARNIKDSRWLGKQWADKANRDPAGSGFVKIPDARGERTRMAKIMHVDNTRGHRDDETGEFMGEKRIVDGVEQFRVRTGEAAAYDQSTGEVSEYAWSPWKDSKTFHIKEFDQGWENYSRQMQDPRYRNRVSANAKAARGGGRAASTFTVGRESALGEGGREAARTATITTTGAASGKAAAAAAQKRKLK